MNNPGTVFDLVWSVAKFNRKTIKRMEREDRIVDWLLYTDKYSDLIQQAKRQTYGVQLENIARTLQSLLFSKGMYHTPDNDYFSLSAIRMALAEKRKIEG